MNYKNRPKWARPLSCRQWRDLQSCQNTMSPTLSRLRSDADYHLRNNITCHSCRSAAKTLGYAPENLASNNAPTVADSKEDK